MTADKPIQGMPCPLCSIDLVMSERDGIEIDYCRKCRGVWLDRGELDKILERSAQYAAAPTATSADSAWTRPAPDQTKPRHEPPHQGWSEQGHAGGHGKHGQYRRKSWLQEIFD